MLQTTAVLDGRKESHTIIIIMMALYGLGIMTPDDTFTRITANCKMKANDASHSNDYEWIILLLYLYGSVRKQQGVLQQPSQLSGWDTRRGEEIPLKVGKHIGP